MSIAEHFIFSWIRCCLHCGKYDPPIRTFCSDCWLKFLQQITVRLHKVSPDFFVITLIDWNDENYDLVLSFVLAQKGGGLVGLISEIISWNLIDINERICGVKVSQNSSFASREVSFEEQYAVPIPAKLRKKDHAYFIASILSEKIGLNFAPNTLKVTTTKIQKSQKFRIRLERKQVEFALKMGENFNQGVLIIDDIVTTGSTLLAAKKALNASGAIGFALVNRFRNT
jgi:predicted amidophosphoribosyltransferase